MLGKFEGENVEQLRHFAKLPLSCVVSELKSVDGWMKNISENDQDTLEMKVELSATEKLKQEFSLPHYKQVEKKSKM